MLRVCAWCRRILGLKRGGAGVTHGMCCRCFRRVCQRPAPLWMRAVEVAGDAACWLILIAGYLLGVGLMYEVLTARADGAPAALRMWATGYSWRESGHARWGTRNALGGSLARPLEGLGHCAVDPAVVPLGSILDVPGAGRRIATDTGGKIRGYDLDVHFDSVGEIRRWGARWVDVRVVRWGWGEQATRKQKAAGVTGKGVAAGVDLGDPAKPCQRKPERPGEKARQPASGASPRLAGGYSNKPCGRGSGTRPQAHPGWGRSMR